MLFTRRTTLLAVLIGGALASPADAFVASSGPDGLKLVEDGGRRAVVTLSVVDSEGVQRYRVESPRRANTESGVAVGPGCAVVEPDVALCDRVAPQVDVQLGSSADEFTAAAGFADPIRITGGGGDDVLRLGDGNDFVEGSKGDEVFGGGGDDELIANSGGTIGFSKLHGGPGNDKLTIRNGYHDLFGDDGDDTLVVEQSDVAFTGGNLTGGAGTDSFRLNGRGNIDARDGIAEQVLCSNRRGAGSFQTSDHAVIDLLDVLDPSLPGGGCATVDRAPRAEQTSVELRNKKLVVAARRAVLKVRCTTMSECVGGATVRVGASTSKVASYRIAGTRTATIRVPLSASARRRMRRTKTVATVELTEPGGIGPRTETRQLRIRR